MPMLEDVDLDMSLHSGAPTAEQCERVREQLADAEQRIRELESELYDAEDRANAAEHELEQRPRDVRATIVRLGRYVQELEARAETAKARIPVSRGSGEDGYRYVRQSGQRWALWERIDGKCVRVGTTTHSHIAELFISVRVPSEAEATA